MADTLHAVLRNGRPAEIMEAHDGISARLAHRAGFDGVWASSFSISAAHGVRDADELTWTDVTRVVEFMVEASEAPVLVDGNTGFGDFNIARRFAAKAMRAGAAGICIEDKVFPKANSFTAANHMLERPATFAGKIKACKDAAGPDLQVIARTEALIVGAGIPEALQRAEVYMNAGADGIFVHSKSASAAEIERFCREWTHDCPIIVSPTTYGSASVMELHAMGVSGVIWGNQSLRAAVKAMQTVHAVLRKDQAGDAVANEICTMDDIFNLLDYDELWAAEKIYEGR